MQPTPRDQDAVVLLALWGLRIFLCIVGAISVYHSRRVYLEPHGRLHRVLGATQFTWLIIESFCVRRWQAHLVRDIIMGCLGVSSTLSAVHSFPHKHVQNAKGQSGTLHPTAIVTQSEMLEHSFYQALNLIQAVYLHYSAYMSNVGNFNSIHRLLGLLFVTAPWWIRRQFPVHSFSANWKEQQKHVQSMSKSKIQSNEVLWLYQIKKWQYVFYKHVILHGVNIGVALASRQSLVHEFSWRVFWLCMNASYVMEFFLQTMVKRHVLQQSNMLLLQRLLMTSSSVAAIMVGVTDGGHVLHFGVCLASVVLNFSNRHHDVFNTMLIGVVGTVVGCYM